MNIIDDLQQRGFFHQTTDIEKLRIQFSEPHSIYAGFDPSSDSLHLGSLIPIVALMHFQKYGHAPIAVVGGATGMIGDPSGKSKERNLQSASQVEKNLMKLKVQLEKYLSFTGVFNQATVLNNNDWMGNYTYMSWLRDIGKHCNINSMLSKESVKGRLVTEKGISYTEFSYMLIQAYDFLHLSKQYNCNTQLGGSDQWGNITMGLQLIRKLGKDTGHGITLPLITDSSGNKFGKSDGNAIWLDSSKTSPYKFYQYLFNVSDDDVGQLLKLLTFLPLHEISELTERHNLNPGKREAQKSLAREVTSMVHGNKISSICERISASIFGKSIQDLKYSELAYAIEDLPVTYVNRANMNSLTILNLALESGISKSNKETSRTMEQGGFYLNNCRINNNRSIEPSDFINNKFLALRKGKRDYHFIIVND